MAYPRSIVFALAAFALAGCCASGTGCYVAVPGVPTAWDGDGPRPDEAAVPRKKSLSRARSTAVTAGAEGRAAARAVADANGEAVPSGDAFAAKEAADHEADTRLMKKLMICRGCLPAADEAIGGVATN